MNHPEWTRQNINKVRRELYRARKEWKRLVGDRYVGNPYTTPRPAGCVDEPVEVKELYSQIVKARANLSYLRGSFR